MIDVEDPKERTELQVRFLKNTKFLINYIEYA